MITFVVASHDEKILFENTLNSDLYRKGKYEFIICRGFKKCTVAYNSVATKIETPYVAYIHHDLQLSDTVEETLLKCINDLESYNWGVAGLAGVTPDKTFIGSCYSYGRPWGHLILDKNSLPMEIKILDELFLLKKNDGYLFDEKIPYNHLYGTDVCLHYKRLGKHNYSIPVKEVNHNANRNRNPLEGYELITSGDYIKTKYPEYMPVKTTCITIQS